MHGLAVGHSHCTSLRTDTLQPSAQLDGYQGLHGNLDEVTFEGRGKRCLCTALPWGVRIVHRCSVVPCNHLRGWMVIRACMATLMRLPLRAGKTNDSGPGHAKTMQGLRLAKG